MTNEHRLTSAADTLFIDSRHLEFSTSLQQITHILNCDLELKDGLVKLIT